MRHMVVIVPEVTGYATIRHVAVSLPYVAALIGEKYMEPGDVKPPEGTELRRRNAPSLRFLVRLALKCDDAEELGKRLRRRYVHQAARDIAAPDLSPRQRTGLELRRLRAQAELALGAATQLTQSRPRP
jgi:hypothetical protein